VQREADPAGPGGDDLLGQDRVVAEVVDPAAAVLLGDRGAEQARRPGRGPYRPVDLAVLLPLLVVRGDLLRDEGPAQVTERVVFVVEDLALHVRQSHIPAGNSGRPHGPSVTRACR